MTAAAAESLRPGAVTGAVDVWVADGTAAASSRVLDRVLERYRGEGLGPPEWSREASGRPVVCGDRGLCVSISHSAGVVLIAAGARCRLGVDIERVRPGPWLLLPEHSLAPSELADLTAVESSSRTEAFLGYWTRKEALLKAAGVGLSVDPRLVELSASRRPSRVLSLPPELGSPGRWSIVDLELDGHVAALAVDLPSPRVRLRRLGAAS